uniref:Uncharacterized protein n=1 Tax=viral metagenome TaxID=1070528 RepID=A0A6M3ITW4_9ZZZZ
MPFIPQIRRLLIKNNKWDELMNGKQPGDRCYIYYREMVDRWKASPRWTTAHEIYKKMRGSSRLSYANMPESFEDKIAEELAWQVFFLWWVVPYEKEREKENGSI